MNTGAHTGSRVGVGCAAVVITLLLGVAGCGSLSQPYQATTEFGLLVPSQATASATAPLRQGALRVSRLRVNPPASSRHFIYRMDDVTFKSDYHNAFVAPPERLLTAAVVDGLITDGPFQMVIEPGSTADGALRLETTVTDLYGDFRDLSSPRAVIRARFILLEDGPAATRQVDGWTLERSEPIPTTAAADLAQGYGRAWASMVDELARGLAPHAR